MKHPVNAHRIPAENVSGLTHEVARLAKRAKRLGVPAPSIFDTGKEETEVFTVVSESGRKRKVTKIFRLIQVFGEQVIVAGYEFVAVLQHETAGTVIRAVPTAGLTEGELAGYRQASPACDHCRLDRNRKDTFVVREVETGVLKQVGRTCLQDFLGNDPQQAAHKATLFALLGDLVSSAEESGWEGGGGSGEAHFTATDWVAEVIMEISEGGWVSGKSAWENGGTSTANRAWQVAVSPRRKAEDHPTEAQVTEAVRVLEAAEEALGAKGETRNDYEHNLWVSIQGSVNFKSKGIVASVVGFVSRHEAWEYKRLNAPKVTSRFHGAVGEKRDDVATVAFTHVSEGFYGARTLVKLNLASDGAILKWWASNDVTGAWKIGETYAITYGVKEHETEDAKYGGHKVTVIARARAHETVEGFTHAVSHECPHCHAAVGTWCQNKKGRASKLHGKRVKLNASTEGTPVLSHPMKMIVDDSTGFIFNRLPETAPAACGECLTQIRETWTDSPKGIVCLSCATAIYNTETAA